MSAWIGVALIGGALVAAGLLAVFRAPAERRAGERMRAVLLGATLAIVVLGAGYALTGGRGWRTALDFGVIVWLGVLALAFPLVTSRTNR